MAVPDLDEIQRRVNESREQFLLALKVYEKDGPDDGRAITEQYLVRFLGAEPKRSPFARGFATEAIDLISDFGEVRRRMVAQVTALNVQSTNATLQVTGDVLDDYVRNTFPAMDSTIPDPTVQFLDWSKRFKAGIRAQDARQAARASEAADIGRRLDVIQRLGASILLARHSTLRRFRRENLELTVQELRHRITEQMNEASKDQILEGLVEAVRVIIERSLKVVFEETIFVKVVILLYKIFSSIRGRVDTAPGAQDLMETLLSVLREQNERFKQLNTEYQAATAKLSELVNARP